MHSHSPDLHFGIKYLSCCINIKTININSSDVEINENELLINESNVYINRKELIVKKSGVLFAALKKCLYQTF